MMEAWNKTGKTKHNFLNMTVGKVKQELGGQIKNGE